MQDSAPKPAVKKRHRFHMPSAFTVLFIIIVIMAILTWIIPAGAYKTDSAGNIIAHTYHQVAAHPQGLWDIFMAPIYGMIGDKKTEGAIQVALFILVIGGFLGVVNKTGALNQGINSIVHRYHGREKKLIPILMILFAIGGSTYGMGEETIAFYPLLIPVMMGVGFDSIVAVAIALVGTQIGCLASTVNPFATGVASDSLHISMGDGLVSRLLLLVILVALSVWYVWSYAAKIEKDPKKSVVYDQREADMIRFDIKNFKQNPDPLTTRQKAVLWLFAATFVIMIVGLVPWTSLNSHWTGFDAFLKWLKGVPFLGNLIGQDATALGTWYFNEITMLFLLMSVIIMWVYHMPESDYIDAFMKGMGEFISVAMIVCVARGIQVIMDSGMITDTILYWGEMSLSKLSRSVFIIITYIFYIPMSFLIPSTSGLAAATMGIIGPIGKFAHVTGSAVITAYQAASGWVNLITPTSAIVMGALTIAHVNISTWWKWIAKLMLYIFIVTCVFLGILVLV